MRLETPAAADSMSSTPLGSRGLRVPRTCTVRARRVHRVSRCHTRGARCPARKGDDVFSVCFLLALCNQNSINASAQALGQRGRGSRLGKVLPVYSLHCVFFLTFIRTSACLGLCLANPQNSEAGRDSR